MKIAKESIKKIIVIFFLINTLFFLAGCKNKNNDELKDKTISELEYINFKIIDMLNMLNNISLENYKLVSKPVELESKKNEKEQPQEVQENQDGQGENTSQEQQGQKQEEENQELINTTEMIPNSVLANNNEEIDWNKIKQKIELLNESWSIIFLDLYSQNIDSNIVLGFSSKLDTAMIAIKNEDKMQSLLALSDLYQSLPGFLEEIEAEDGLQKIRQTQMYVINAYCLADDIKNPEINSNLQKAKQVYLEVLNNKEYTKNKTFKTNKIYVLLNELMNSLEKEDQSIFYIKYRNFMETINEI